MVTTTVDSEGVMSTIVEISLLSTCSQPDYVLPPLLTTIGRCSLDQSPVDHITHNQFWSLGVRLLQAQFSHGGFMSFGSRDIPTQVRDPSCKCRRRAPTSPVRTGVGW